MNCIDLVLEWADSMGYSYRSVISGMCRIYNKDVNLGKHGKPEEALARRSWLVDRIEVRLYNYEYKPCILFVHSDVLYLEHLELDVSDPDFFLRFEDFLVKCGVYPNVVGVE